MNRTIATIATVAALSLGGAASAQTVVVEEGNYDGYDMLQTALMNDFTALGLPTDALEGLTLGQVAAIKGIVESDDSDSNKTASIEAIIDGQ